MRPHSSPARHRRRAVPPDAARRIDRLGDAAHLHRLGRRATTDRDRDEHGRERGARARSRRAARGAARVPHRDRRPLPARVGADRRLDARRGPLGSHAGRDRRRSARRLPAVPDLPRQSRAVGDDLSLSRRDRRRRRPAADRLPVPEGVRTRLPAGDARAPRGDPAGDRPQGSIVRHAEDRRDRRHRARRCRASSAS